MKLVDLTGQRFGRLTVLSRAENVGKQTAWLCRCDCGNEKIVLSCNLKTGNTLSCGCRWADIVPKINKEVNTRHGDSNSKLHKTWVNMRYRCYNPNCKSYGNYGGRGITICEEWETYENFRDWSLANGFAEHLSIDRIDVDGNYEPSNCRWVSDKTQQNNKRTNRNLSYNGETHTLSEWAEITGIHWTTLKARIDLGWSTKDILTKKP